MSRGAPVAKESADAPGRLPELLAVAARLFNEKGYRNTSLAEIGAAMGMNKASLYYYVPSKQALLEELVFSVSGRLRAPLAALEADAALSPADALERLVRNHCRVLLDHPDAFGIVIHQRQHIDGKAMSEITGRERAYLRGVRRLVERGIGAGAFRRADPDAMARLLIDTMNGVLRWPRRGSAEEIVDEVWAWVRAALLAPSP